MTEPIQVKQRINSIDMLRGAIMLIMAIDHVRDFFYFGGPTSNPTDLATTTTALFLTRWITHFCAPTFVFLSGVSAYIAGTRRTKTELSMFLIKRGFWLVLVELVILSFAFSLNPHYNTFIFQVLWAIGCSMVILGLLIWARASVKVIAVIGLLIFFGHDVWDYIKEPVAGTAAFDLEKLFFTSFGTLIQLNPTHYIFDLYAIIPWAGVMMLGYAFGQLYQPGYDAQKRKKILLYTGLSAIALCIVLRFINKYGDPAPWSVQHNAVFTFLSFINFSKYPPSLMYLLTTVGTALTVLALTEKANNKLSAFFMVYGNVPFFYYVLHFYLIRAINVMMFFAAGYTSKDIIKPNSPFLFRPATFGYPLWVIYLIWLIVISILYFPCRWFSKYKKTHKQWWLSYL